MTPASAGPVAVAQTMAFLEELLPEGGGRLLEVGCGTGEVAAELTERGWKVVALDASAEAVAAARVLGVDARQASFPDVPELPEPPVAEGERFDAVYFGRVLHHVESLAETLDRVAGLLRRGGVLVVEDFAWERVDRKTAVWGYGVLRYLSTQRYAPLAEWDEWDFEGDSLEHWQRSHREEGLHTGEAMRGQLEARFALELEAGAPYFYRYVERHLARHADGAAVAERVLRGELTSIRDGGILPLGQRYAARAAVDR